MFTTHLIVFKDCSNPPNKYSLLVLYNCVIEQKVSVQCTYVLHTPSNCIVNVLLLK